MTAVRYMEIALEALGAIGVLAGVVASALPPGKAHDFFQRIGQFAGKKPTPMTRPAR